MTPTLVEPPTSKPVLISSGFGFVLIAPGSPMKFTMFIVNHIVPAVVKGAAEDETAPHPCSPSN